MLGRTLLHAAIALKRLCVLYPLEAPFLQVGLVEGKAHAWLWRRRSLAPKDSPGEIQGEQFTLGTLIRAVRMAAGSQVEPAAVRIESPKSEWALRTEGLAQSRVDSGGPVLAIAIPHDLLVGACRDPRRAGPRPMKRTRAHPATCRIAYSGPGTARHGGTPVDRSWRRDRRDDPPDAAALAAGGAHGLAADRRSSPLRGLCKADVGPVAHADRDLDEARLRRPGPLHARLPPLDG